MKKTTLRFATFAAFASIALPALADTQRFVGTDGNWFNARNWSNGHLPGRGDDVVIGPGKRVVVDPSAGYLKVVLRDILISSLGSVETLPGIVWTTRNEVVEGQLIHRGTDASTDLDGVGLYLAAGSGSSGGVWLNPTPKSKRIIVLSSFKVGLGGTEAAAPGKVGRGYYANMTSQYALVGGSLDIEFKYGFVPHAGDIFRILKAGRIEGRYAGLPEGAMVKRIGDIGLFIHYTTREHILLARQIGV